MDIHAKETTHCGTLQGGRDYHVLAFIVDARERKDKWGAFMSYVEQLSLYLYRVDRL